MTVSLSKSSNEVVRVGFFRMNMIYYVREGEIDETPLLVCRAEHTDNILENINLRYPIHVKQFFQPDYLVDNGEVYV